MDTLDALHPHNAGERKTLADLIFAKLDSQAAAPVGGSMNEIQKVHQSMFNMPFPVCTPHLTSNSQIATHQILLWG